MYKITNIVTVTDTDTGWRGSLPYTFSTIKDWQEALTKSPKDAIKHEELASLTEFILSRDENAPEEARSKGIDQILSTASFCWGDAHVDANIICTSGDKTMLEVIRFPLNDPHALQIADQKAVAILRRVAALNASWRFADEDLRDYLFTTQSFCGC